MRALFLALVLLATPALAQDASPPVAPGDVAQRAIEGYIRPSFDAFLDLSGNLEAGLDALCAEPSPARLEEARGHFRGAVDGYSRISFLRFGPLVADNRSERLLLWPDPRGIALRQVQELLAEEPQDALDPAALRGKSVALQGFNALEFVLFGSGSDTLADEASYRCRYGAAVADAIRAVAEALAEEWHDPAGISQRLTAPTPADADYRSVREVLEEFVGVLSHGAESIRDTQLLPFLGRNGGEPRPRSAPLWRSNATEVLIGGGLKGIAGFVAASGIGEAAGEAGGFIADAVAFEVRNIARAEDVITGTVEAAIADPHQLQGYRYLVVLTQSLQGLIGDQLAAALGLSVGFSSLDGD